MLTVLANIVKNEDDATLAFLLIRNKVAKPAEAYLLGMTLLRTKFSEEESRRAIYANAIYDADHENDRRLANKAKMAIARWHGFNGRNDFIRDYKNNGIAAMVYGDILYVAAPCQKPDSKEIQLSKYCQGMGASGDTVRDTIEEIADTGNAGGGIPNTAKHISYDELLKIEEQYI